MENNNDSTTTETREQRQRRLAVSVVSRSPMLRWSAELRVAFDVLSTLTTVIVVAAAALMLIDGDWWPSVIINSLTTLCMLIVLVTVRLRLSRIKSICRICVLTTSSFDVAVSRAVVSLHASHLTGCLLITYGAVASFVIAGVSVLLRGNSYATAFVLVAAFVLVVAVQQLASHHLGIVKAIEDEFTTSEFKER